MQLWMSTPNTITARFHAAARVDTNTRGPCPQPRRLGQRGNDPDIDWFVRIRSNPTNITRLEGSKQFGLQINRQFAHFIEKERPAGCLFEGSHAPIDRARERTFFVSE